MPRRKQDIDGLASQRLAGGARNVLRDGTAEHAVREPHGPGHVNQHVGVLKLVDRPEECRRRYLEHRRKVVVRHEIPHDRTDERRLAGRRRQFGQCCSRQPANALRHARHHELGSTGVDTDPALVEGSPHELDQHPGLAIRQCGELAKLLGRVGVQDVDDDLVDRWGFQRAERDRRRVAAPQLAEQVIERRRRDVRTARECPQDRPTFQLGHE